MRFKTGASVTDQKLQNTIKLCAEGEKQAMIAPPPMF